MHLQSDQSDLKMLLGRHDWVRKELRQHIKITTFNYVQGVKGIYEEKGDKLKKRKRLKDKIW